MKNLILMTDFVLEQEFTIEVQSLNNQWASRVSRYNKIMSYAKFLKQPLELWMFVPCDEDGNVLEEPKNYVTWLGLHESKGSTIGFTEHEKYQQAKERCLFDGNFTTKILNQNTVVYVNGISFYTSWNKHKTIESLTGVESTLNKSGLFTLTQTAINLIGL